MSDPYKRLKELLSLPLDERGKHFQELIVAALAFFEKAKYMMTHGSPEEKARAIEEMKKIQLEITQELKRITEQSGMTEEQLGRYLENPNVLPEKDQQLIQESKKQIQQLAQDLKNTLSSSIPSTSPPPEKEKKAGPKGKKQKWIKS